jgi:hypothetical protein
LGPSTLMLHTFSSLAYPPVSSTSSSSSTGSYHAVGPLVDPYRSYISISFFQGLLSFLLPFSSLVPSYTR